MKFADFEALPLLGILRGVAESVLVPLADSVATSGLRALEITMNTPGAASKIAKLQEVAAGRFLVGAGTVVGVGDLEEALSAGASFVVTPVFESDVVHRCVDRGIPVLPGALTPLEIHRAHRAGATMVKVFPARVFGPSYFADLLGPFADLRLLACGGVDTTTLPEYFAAGAAGAAIGGSIFRNDWLASADFAKIEGKLKPLVMACAASMERRKTRARSAANDE